jgi:hypothetical protein
MAFCHHLEKLEVFRKPHLGTLAELSPAVMAPAELPVDTTDLVVEQAEAIFLLSESPELLALK